MHMIMPTSQCNMESACLLPTPPPQRKILFTSAHSIVDFSNGASVATLDVLQGLAIAGLDCQAFCTSKLDFQQEALLEQIVGDLREPYQIQPSICGGERANLLFTRLDYCSVVASEFARRQYRDTVGIDCETLPYPIDWDRVTVEDRQPRFVTFVNPCLEKGVYAFARIADELRRRRPDIPLLVVESRGTRDTLAACGIDPDAHGNITFMPHTTDCRRFWSLTKLALMPSLWWENQPLVAIEAMINGIPVIGSDRGGTPETLGASGFALPLPDRLTPISKILPSAEEVEPWVETVIRLWDDTALHEEQSALASREAQRWHPDRLRPLYANFFRNVRMQLGTRFVARTAAETARLAPALEPPRPAGERVAEGRVRGSPSAATAESRNDRAEACSARPGPPPAAPPCGGNTARGRSRADSRRDCRPAPAALRSNSSDGRDALGRRSVRSGNCCGVRPFGAQRGDAAEQNEHDAPAPASRPRDRWVVKKG